MGRISSRKLAAAVCAMGVTLALMLGLAIVRPIIFTEAPNLIYAALITIGGLGGFSIYRQSVVDEKEPTFRLDSGSTIVKRGQ